MSTGIDNYGELKTAVADWLKRNDLTSDIPKFIGLAENRIGNELDIPAIESRENLTIDDRTVALPSGYLEQRSHYIDTDDPPQRITYRAPEAFWDYDRGKGNGFPSFYTIEKRELVFSPFPEGTYDGVWLILKRPLALSADSDTNEILQDHTGLYLYGALLESAPFLKNDPRLLTWATMYQDAMALAQNLGKRQRFPKGQKVSRSRVGITSGGRTRM